MQIRWKIRLLATLFLLAGYGMELLHSQTSAIDTLFSFQVDTLYGYETANHVVVIPPKYRLAFPFRYGVAPVILPVGGYREQVSALINLKGEYVIPPQPGSFNYFMRDSLSIEFYGANKKRTRYTLDGRPIFSCTDCNTRTMPGSKNFLVAHSYITKLDTFEVRDSAGAFLYSVVGYNFEFMGNYPKGKTETDAFAPFWFVRTTPQINGSGNTVSGIFLDYKGKILLDSVHPIRFYQGIGVLGRNGKYALVDLSLKERIPFSAGYTGMFYWAGSNCVSVMKDSLFGIVDTNGTVILPCKYSNALHPEGGGFAFRLNIPYTRTQKGGDYYLLRNGDTLLNNDYWLESGNSNGQLDFSGPLTIKNKKTGKYGIISYDSSVTVPCKYDCLSGLTEGRIVFFRGDTAGYLNAQGKEIIELWFPCYGLSGFTNGRALASILLPGGRDQYPTAQIRSDGQTTMARRFVWIDTMGQIINRQSFDWVTKFRGGVSLVINNGEQYMVDTNLVRMKVQNKYDYCCYPYLGYSVITDGKNYGLVDSTGKIVLPVEYDEIAMREDGPGGIGFLDNTGHADNTYGQFIVPNIVDGKIVVRKGKQEEEISIPRK